MQRMYLALMLNADLPHLGLVPLHPAAKRQDPGTKPTAPPAAYCATSQLPDDLLDSESYDEDNAWHAHCPAGVLTPWSVSSIDQFANSFEERGSVKLNPEQRSAVAAAVTAGPGRKPMTLFGPPGTGKTVVLVELALQLFHQDPDARLLICAPQNFSADLLCSRLAAAGITPTDMIRCNDPRLFTTRTKDDVLPFCHLDKGTDMFKWPSLTVLISKRIIVTTCIATGFLLRYRQHLLARPLRIAHVLIDEAGQSPLPEALLPLCLADPEHGSCFLAGDPQQLGPVVRSPVAAAAGLAHSLLDRLISYYRALPPTLSSRHYCTMLVRNYRSHERLLQLPSDMFYRGQLRACVDARTAAAPKWSELDDSVAGKGESECHTLMYGVLGKQVRDGDSPTWFNPQEAEVVARLVASLIRENQETECENPVTQQHVGVICTCRAQVVRVRNLLRALDLGAVRVGTVDDYQGQEERVVFISTVLCQAEPNPQSIDSVGFFSNPKRFNVATTRAQALLVVVGHPGMLMADPCWRRLVHFCVALGAVRGAGAEILQQIQGGGGGGSATRGSGPRGNASTTHDDGGARADEDDDEDDGRPVANVRGGVGGAGGVGDTREQREAYAMVDALQEVAQAAFLGLGHADEMYPDEHVPGASAFAGEQQWRVAL